MAGELTSAAVAMLLESPRTFDLFSRELEQDEALLRRGLHPPLLVWWEHAERPAVVWGWQLLQRLAALDIVAVPVSLVNDDAAEALELAIRAEGRPGRFGWDELSAVAACMRELGLEDNDPKLSALLFGRPASVLREVRRYEELPPPLQRLVASGAVDLKSAERATGVPEAVLERFGAGAEQLSFSRRREMLAMLYEFCVVGRRETEAVLALLDEVFAAPDPLSALRAHRYPRLRELERQFEAFCECYASGSGVELSAPAKFEGSAFGVQFQFESAPQLARRIRCLQAIERNCDELFRLL